MTPIIYRNIPIDLLSNLFFLISRIKSQRFRSTRLTLFHQQYKFDGKLQQKLKLADKKVMDPNFKKKRHSLS